MGYIRKSSISRQQLHHEQLAREYEQAWEHYRHVENQRNAFLAFYYTVALASMGFVASLAARNVPDAAQGAALAACPIAAFSGAIGLLVWLSVLKFGAVLRFYFDLWIELRPALLAVDGSDIESVGRLNVANWLPRGLVGWLVGPQALSESGCLVLAVISLSYPIAYVASHWPVPGHIGRLLSFGSAILAVVLLGVLLLEIFLHRARISFKSPIS